MVVAGRPTLHRAVARLLADPAVAVYALADERGLPWTDVAGSVRAVGALPPLRPDPEWLRRWAAADKAAAGDARRSPRYGPVGMQLARALVAALADGTQLVLGSSNPVRDVALAAAPRDGVVVRSNRGVAGIDGTVSTAMGAALAHDGPTVALLGDLTLLHDTTGLVVGPDEPGRTSRSSCSTTAAAASSTCWSRARPSTRRRSSGSSAPRTPSTWRRCARRWACPRLRRPVRRRGHLGHPASGWSRCGPSAAGLRDAHAALRARVARRPYAVRLAPSCSATLKATSLAAGHGARVLFSGLDLVVAPGDVVGLVGVNGAGKSTLLRMLAGEPPAEEGTVASARRTPPSG